MTAKHRRKAKAPVASEEVPSTLTSPDVGAKRGLGKAKALADRQKIGKRIGFTPVPDTTMDDLLAAVSSGSSVNAALRELDVTPAQFYRTIAANPLGLEKYRRAREACMDAVCDSLIELADQHPPLVASGENSDPRVDPGWVAWQRNRIYARQWMLGRLAPKKYGGRLAAEASSPNSGSIDASSANPEPDVSARV